MTIELKPFHPEIAGEMTMELKAGGGVAAARHGVGGWGAGRGYGGRTGLRARHDTAVRAGYGRTWMM